MPWRILVLEDDENFCNLLNDVLEDAGFEVQASVNPDQAVESAQWSKFDLLIADVRMAGSTDGIGAAEAILKIQPHIYRIIMTGFTDDEAPARAMKQGVDFYLYKPFKLEKLLNVVKAVLKTQLDHTTYQHKLAKVFRSAKSFLVFLEKPEKEQRGTMDQARLAFHKAYFSGMQSANLTVNAALSIWDALISLEYRYEQLAHIMGPETEALAEQYRRLQVTAENYARKRSMGDGSKNVAMLSFSPLYAKVKDLSLTFAQYMMAPTTFLWLLAKVRNPGNTELDQEALALFGFKTLPKGPAA